VRALPAKRTDLEKIIKSQNETIEWLEAELREKRGETLI
jgi:hypothetical protein